jgi:hypothetical protein
LAADAAEAASAAALAAAAESAAAEAAASAAAGGGVVSAAGAGASVLLPQALKTNAATSALRASLVFIYQYPRILRKSLRPSWFGFGPIPNVTGDFRVFCPIFISLLLGAPAPATFRVVSRGLGAYFVHE